MKDTDTLNGKEMMKIVNNSIKFLVLLLTPFAYADIHLTTLDNWEIFTYDEESLMIAKSNEHSNKQKSILGFHVVRPLCVAHDPVFMLESKEGTFSDKDIVHALMKIDKSKPKYLHVEKTFSFQDTDQEGKEINHFTIEKFPPFARANKMEVTFKQTTQLENFVMDLTGLQEAKYEAEEICNSPYPIATVSRMEKI